MSSLHKNIDGIAAHILVVALVCVILIGGLGWWVYLRGSISSYDECVNAGGTVFLSYPSTCRKNGRTFTQPAVTTSPLPMEDLDADKLVYASKNLVLPSGWKNIENDNTRLSYAGGPNDCQLVMAVLEDSAAKKSQAATYAQQLFKADLARLADKGYAVTRLDDGGLKVDGGEGASTYTTMELRTQYDGTTERETYAYIVGDGKIGSIHVACRGTQYAQGQSDRDGANDMNVIHSVILPTVHFRVQQWAPPGS